ncbi:septum formation family protein [Nocardioides sp.]|uniref:septum formation family protein n=1 Tax=Nocardioides sp. TaxID=35761 RepID=UPI0035646F80
MRAHARTAGLIAALAILLSACGEQADPNIDPDQVDSMEMPEVGACRVLTPEDVAQRSNATVTVDCEDKHTAETFAVGELPSELHDVDYGSSALGAFAFETCGSKFEEFTGADESLVMRTVVSWAWFRPSEKAWDNGARWYRCDVVGGGEQSKRYLDLPASTRGLLSGRPKDRWLVCVNGETVESAPKIPCTEPHVWRAVTTIKLGQPADPYPGDRLVEVRTRDFCSDSVGAWLGYPPSYDFGYTWFHEAEWKAGNRRSVCWAKTAA